MGESNLCFFRCSLIYSSFSLSVIAWNAVIKNRRLGSPSPLYKAREGPMVNRPSHSFFFMSRFSFSLYEKTAITHANICIAKERIRKNSSVPSLSSCVKYKAKHIRSIHAKKGKAPLTKSLSYITNVLLIWYRMTQKTNARHGTRRHTKEV